MLGYTEAELCAMTFPEFTHPEDLSADLAQYERMVSGEISHYQLEKRFLRKDGRIVWGRLTVSLVRLEEGKPLYAVGMVEDITDRKELEKSLREAQRWEATSQQEFARELLNATEQERRALGSELHDTLGQDLSIISNRVHQALAQPGLSSSALDHLTAISQAASSAISEVRRLVRDLRPWQIEEAGFTDSIRALVKRTAETALAQIDIRIDDVDREIKGRTAIHLYRIVQESLNNLVKHSKADRARFTLERDIKCIRLCLWDNGRGFEMNPESRPRGLGLTSILERAQMISGTADIQSAPGAGTRITIVLPLRWD
jgi:PAS domain S-box-containing protein